MNVSCGSCPAKYAIPDEKVRGRKVRIVCKRCGAPIIVDGTVGTGPSAQAQVTTPRVTEGSTVSSQAATAAAARRRGMKQTMIGIAPPSPGAAPAPTSPLGAFAQPAPQAVTKRTIVGGLEAPSRSAALGRPEPVIAAPEPPPPAPPSAPEWTVAITDDQHEEMSTGEVVELFAAGTINEETFIWKEGMEDWKTPLEIPELAKRIEARGGRARSSPRASQALTRTSPGDTLAAAGLREPVEKQGPGTPMGVWREPGNAGWGEIPGWNDPELGGGGDVSFDDVTVAMAAPQAEELLRAAGADLSSGASRGSPEERGPFSAEAAPLSESLDVVTAQGPVPGRAEVPTPIAPPAGPSSERAASPGFATPLAMPAASEQSADSEPLEQRALRRSSAPDLQTDLFAEARHDDQAAAAQHDAHEPPVPPSTMTDSTGQPKLTGARNESSVLFSLDALIKPEEGEAAEAHEGEEDVFGLSQRTVEEAAPNERPSEPARELKSLIEPEPRVPEVVAAPVEAQPTAPVAAAARPMSRPPEPEPASRSWLWAVVLLTLAILGAGGALLLTRPKSIFGEAPAPPTATAPEAPSETAAAVAPAPAEQPAEPAATEPTPAPSASAGAAAASDAGAVAPSAPSAASASAATPEPSAADAAIAPAAPRARVHYGKAPPTQPSAAASATSGAPSEPAHN